MQTKQLSHQLSSILIWMGHEA